MRRQQRTDMRKVQGTEVRKGRRTVERKIYGICVPKLQKSGEKSARNSDKEITRNRVKERQGKGVRKV